MNPYRLGIIKYTNVAPLLHSLEHELSGQAIDWVRGVPTEINTALLEGRVDLANISAFEFIQNADRLRALRGLSYAESPRAGKPPVALRAPCVSPALTACCSSIASTCSMVFSTALYTNFKEGRCLTYIGREGLATTLIKKLTLPPRIESAFT